VLVTSPFFDAIDAVSNVNLTAALASGSLVAALSSSAVTLAAAPQTGVLLHFGVQCPSPACDATAAMAALTPDRAIRMAHFWTTSTPPISAL
jgi:hypothetical protein